MKAILIVVILALAGALGALYVFYSGQVADLNTRIDSLQAELKTTRAELQSNTISLGVYQAQHAKKDELLGKLESENKRLRKRLGVLTPGDPEGMAADALHDKLLGMSSQRVKTFLGEPASVLGPQSEWWYYKGNIAFDPATRQPYGSVQILFATGHVARVTFTP